MNKSLLKRNTAFGKLFRTERFMVSFAMKINITGYYRYLTIVCLLILISCSAKLPRFTIGHSISGTHTVEETLFLYLQAKCAGDASLIAMLIEPDTWEFISDEQYCLWIVWLERLPEACNLKIVTSTDWDTSSIPGKSYHSFFLIDESDPAIRFMCSFKTIGNRIYLAEPLRSNLLTP